MLLFVVSDWLSDNPPCTVSLCSCMPGITKRYFIVAHTNETAPSLSAVKLVFVPFHQRAHTTSSPLKLNLEWMIVWWCAVYSNPEGRVVVWWFVVNKPPYGHSFLQTYIQLQSRCYSWTRTWSNVYCRTQQVFLGPDTTSISRSEIHCACVEALKMVP